MNQQLRGRKLSGRIKVRKFGSQDGFVKIGNVTELTTTREVETEELASTDIEDWGEAIESITKPGVTELTAKWNSWDKLALARSMMGEAIDLSTTPKNVSAEEVTVPEAGEAKLANADIDPATLVVKSIGGTPATIAADKYQLSAQTGFITFTDPSLTAGTKLSVAYKTKGSKGFSIAANSLERLDLECILEGKDRITGNACMLHIYHAVLTADGGLNWMDDAWWESGMKGKLILVEGKRSVYDYTEWESA